jgi:hypothetical protein
LELNFVFFEGKNEEGYNKGYWVVREEEIERNGVNAKLKNWQVLTGYSSFVKVTSLRDLSWND